MKRNFAFERQCDPRAQPFSPKSGFIFATGFRCRFVWRSPTIPFPLDFALHDRTDVAQSIGGVWLLSLCVGETICAAVNNMYVDYILKNSKLVI